MSPEPVTMYLSSTEMSQLRTEEDSFDWETERKQIRLETQRERERERRRERKKERKEERD